METPILPVETLACEKPKKICLPEIPVSYLVALLAIAMVVLRSLGIDSWTTAAMGIISGWIMGKHVEQSKNLN